ncbi:MAG: enoyl-CoA hydratase/isomerase family protein [Actinomycetota bacterium]
MTDLRYFTYDVDGAVATITFNRPEKRNGLTTDVMLEFERLIHDVRDDPSLRVVIATGTGTAFCAGADLSGVQKATDERERASAQADLNRVPRIIGRVFDAMVHAEIVTIAAVNGYAVGGGWSLACGFDHVIAVDGARFWLPEVEVGMPFRGLANIGLTQRLGPALAKEAMILGRRFSAEELAALRVINQVCETDELLPLARQIADRYLSIPWKAAMATRREINAAVYGPQLY